MTELELKRLHVIYCSLDGKIAVSKAATALGLSGRHIKQLKKEIKELGVESIINGNRGRKPTHTINTTIAQRIVELKTSHKYHRLTSCIFKSCLRNIKILIYRILLFTIFFNMQT